MWWEKEAVIPTPIPIGWEQVSTWHLSILRNSIWIASKAAGGEKARHDSPFRLVNSATNRSMDGKYVPPYGVSFKSAGGTRTIGRKGRSHPAVTRRG